MRALKTISPTIQSGFGLIEVIVSMLVIATGLLGVLGMQTQALKMSQDTYYFTQANMLVNDLYERIRVNQVHAIEDSGYASDFWEHRSESSNACDTKECTSENLADWDLNQWKAQLMEMLPNAYARVVIENSKVSGQDSKKVTITIAYIPNTNNVVNAYSEYSSEYETFTFETRI